MKRIGAAADIPPGTVRAFGDLTVGNANGEFFATGGKCRHLGADLAKGSIDEVQDCLIEAKQKAFLDDAHFDRLYTLSRRAAGTNVNYQKYLRRCIETGTKPWLKAIDDEPQNP